MTMEGATPGRGDASASGGTMKGGDPALMGGHTEPTPQGAEFAQGAQDRAKAGREAQQRQLADKTGDTLYPASGKPSSPTILLAVSSGSQEHCRESFCMNHLLAILRLKSLLVCLFGCPRLCSTWAEPSFKLLTAGL